MNNLTADDDEHYYREDEELTYHVSIWSAEEHFELRLDHDTASTDRHFLAHTYQLRELASPDNQVLFELYRGSIKYGTLYFFLPPQLSYPVSSVMMALDQVSVAPANLLLVFKRLSDFRIELTTDEPVQM